MMVFMVNKQASSCEEERDPTMGLVVVLLEPSIFKIKGYLSKPYNSNHSQLE